MLWVGTAGVWLSSTPGHFHLVRCGTSSCVNSVFGIAEDRKGWLWIATSNQVLRVDRDPLLRGAAEVADVSRYGLAEGLLGIEGVKRQRSVVSDTQGRIWFSMDRGFSVVDPSRVVSTSAPALAHIESVSADGHARWTPGSVGFPPAAGG